MKKNVFPSSDLTPSNVFKLFIKYPLSYFPAIEEGQIESFISKEKVLRLSSTSQLFDASFANSLKQITDTPRFFDFFQELDEKGLKHLPILSLDERCFKILPTKHFNAVYRPIDGLSDAALVGIFKKIDVPVALFNTHLKIVFKNDAFGKNFKALTKANALKTALDLPSILALTDKTDPASLQLNVEGMKLSFQVQCFEVAKSSVFLLRG